MNLVSLIQLFTKSIEMIHRISTFPEIPEESEISMAINYSEQTLKLFYLKPNYFQVIPKMPDHFTREFQIMAISIVKNFIGQKNLLKNLLELKEHKLE